VGLGGIEPPTSRLSGVRSNHLSYRPNRWGQRRSRSGRLCTFLPTYPVGGPTAWFFSQADFVWSTSPFYRNFGSLRIGEDVSPFARAHRPRVLSLFGLRPVWYLLRKEVIQPHLPIRLPCYDFTPLTNHTFGAFLPLRGWSSDFGCSQLGWCDGRCVQGPGTYSPRHADPRLLAIPTSWSRVADSNPN
jgi:hypothetical protein